MKTHHPSFLPRFIRSLDLRNARITRFAPLLLSVLVGVASFTVMRGAQMKTEVSEPERDLRELAARVQVSLRESGSAAPRIHGGDDDEDFALSDSAGAESAAHRERRLERGGQLFERAADRWHYSALRSLLIATSEGETGESSYAGAERQLIAALTIEPKQAALWNDLGVVYLSWADRHDRPRLLLDAYAATAAAKRLGTLEEARSNQALTLEGLGLAEPAANAVELYRDYVRRLERAALAKDAKTFLRVADEFPAAARRFVEESLLPAWAGLALEDDRVGAERRLDLARVWANHAVQRLASPPDPLLRDSIAAIDDAARRGDVAAFRELARGHQAFGAGLAAFPERLEEAIGHFEDAERKLGQGGSPFAGWATFYRAACLHIRRDLSAAVGIFESLGSAAEHFPSLRIRLGWGRALTFNQLGLARPALAEYGKASALAAATGDYESSVALGYQQAEVTSVLDLYEHAWRHLRGALKPSAPFPVRDRYRINVLFTAADQARARPGALPQALRGEMEKGFAELRRLFQSNAVEIADRWGTPTFRAQNRSRLAAMLAAEGSAGEAAREWRRAEEAVREIPDPVMREQQLSELALDAAGWTDSAISDHQVERAFVVFSQRGPFYRAIEAAQMLAERAARRQDPGAQERWLAGAQEVIDKLAGGLEPIRDRRAFLAASRAVSRTRMRLALEAFDAPDRIFDRYLREQQLRRSAPLSEPESGRDPRAQGLARDQAFVVFLELPDQLGALVATADGAVWRPLPVSQLDLAHHLHELRNEIGVLREREGEARSAFAIAVDSRLAVLSRGLFAPIEDLLPEAGHLGLALDDAFGGIPFEALFADEHGRRLVERFEVSRLSAPDALSNRPHSLRRPLAGLLVGASIPASSWGLGALPYVDEEIAAIGQNLGMPADRRLVAAESTRRRVLESLTGSSWLHFAGHAVDDPGDAAASLLILAEDAAEPAFLTVTDLVEASGGRLEMVVLAGCDTARSSTGGLAQGLERSGVPVTIGSLWPISDAATAEFFEEFYRLLAAGVPPAQAFHETQRAALRSGDPQLASVATWGAFAVWGR